LLREFAIDLIAVNTKPPRPFSVLTIQTVPSAPMLLLLAAPGTLTQEADCAAACWAAGMTNNKDKNEMRTNAPMRVSFSMIHPPVFIDGLPVWQMLSRILD